MCRPLFQWRGVVALTRQLRVVNQPSRCVSSLIKFPPSGLQRTTSQQCRTAYNPFHPIGESEDMPHAHESDEKPDRQQKRQEKRRKLLQDSHNAHSHLHFEDMEDRHDGDSVLFHDVRIVGWSPEEIYNVVMNVGEYHNFIPYCMKSTVFSQYTKNRHEIMEAELQVGFQLYQLSYTSKVDGSTNLDGKKIVTAVCENKKLFEHLNMEWKLGPGPKEHTTIMNFDVSFRFTSRLYNTVASMFKSSVVDQMIPAFETRLRQVYGEPTILSSLSATAGKVHRRRKRR